MLEGQVAFGMDDQQDLVASSGTFVHVPRGTTHWFRFGTDGGVMLSITSRAGAHAFFTDVDREVSPTDPDLDVLVGIAAAHGLAIPIPSA